MTRINIADVEGLPSAAPQIANVLDMTIEGTGRTIYGVQHEADSSTESVHQVAAGLPARDGQAGPQPSVIVTGGAGYVGSVLVRKLLHSNFRVVCVDNLRFGGRSLVDVWGHKNFHFGRVDLTDFDQVDDIISSDQHFAIVHLAAVVGDPACSLEPELARRTNRDVVVHLLEKAVDARVPRFVFVSTCSNYGKMKDSDGYVDERSALNPVSLYAELKVNCEKVILHEMDKTEWFCPIVLRFATVFGMSPRMRFDLTVNEFTKELAGGKELLVFGEQFWRPYCHVDDCSSAILAVLKGPREKVAYNVFNVGNSDQNYTKKMIVEEILKQIPDGRVKYVAKVDDPRDYRVNFDKVKSELGFRTSKTVPEGVAEILSALRLGIIDDPYNQYYYNIPITS